MCRAFYIHMHHAPVIRLKLYKHVIYIYIYVHMCMYVCMYVCMIYCVIVCVCVCVCMCAYTIVKINTMYRYVSLSPSAGIV